MEVLFMMGWFLCGLLALFLLLAIENNDLKYNTTNKKPVIVFIAGLGPVLLLTVLIIAVSIACGEEENNG